MGFRLTSFPLLILVFYLVSCRGEKEVSFDGDPALRDEAGLTPLLRAARDGDEAEVMLLLNLVSVDEKSPSGETALTFAAKGGHLAAMTRVLQKGANPDVRTAQGEPLVNQALQDGKLAVAQLLVKHGADLGAPGQNGRTPLHDAVARGHLSLVQSWERQGADLKVEKGAGHGLLHVALDHEQHRLVSHLLGAGLDPKALNKDGDSVLHRALHQGLATLLPKFIKLGSELNDRDSAGWSPLHLAVQSGRPEVVVALLEAGAEVGQMSDQGELSVTPLELAFDRGSVGCAEVLLKAGAPVRDEVYQSVALPEERGLEAVRLLMELGYSTGSERAGDTPLALAVRTGKERIVRVLLDSGASPNSHDASGQSAFHVAVAQGNVALVDLLAEYGADVTEPFQTDPSSEFLAMVSSEGVAHWALKNASSLRPLALATDRGDLAMMRCLMRHGATSGQTSRIKGTSFWPLFFGARRQDTDAQQVLFGMEKLGKEGKRWIRVNLKTQKLVMFENGEVKFTSAISSGKKGSRTPTGKYVISNKYREWKSTLYHSSMPYFQRLSGGDFGFHYGVLPGYPASHGCIRMPMSKARALYQLTRPGMFVEIVKN